MKRVGKGTTMVCVFHEDTSKLNTVYTSDMSRLHRVKGTALKIA